MGHARALPALARVACQVELAREAGRKRSFPCEL